jgi:hypothetical protein
MLAFSRPPDRVLTDPQRDTKQHRALKTALAENPYVFLAANTDQIFASGQQTTVGTPWQSDVLAYEDGYAFDILGNFNLKFRHDGVYEISRVDVNPYAVDEVPEPHVLNPRYGAEQWRSL